MAKSKASTAPVRTEPTSWEHFALWQRVRDALYALPLHFQSKTNIEGMLVSDIFTLNSALGATIEEQVVAALNKLRTVWDVDKKYQAYGFVRQSQAFPDVLLRKRTNGHDILLGVELKGWYILSKEGMPNFRFTVSPLACNSWDLLVVVPWTLSNVLSGTPVIHSPFVEMSRFAAEQRNHYWEHEREARDENGIQFASGIGPYPRKSDPISDRARSDGGGNFGRLARYGVMSEYVRETMTTLVCGISASDWLGFLKKHARDTGGKTTET